MLNVSSIYASISKASWYHEPHNITTQENQSLPKHPINTPLSPCKHPPCAIPMNLEPGLGHTFSLTNAFQYPANKPLSNKTFYKESYKETHQSTPTNLTVPIAVPLLPAPPLESSL